MNLYTLQRFNSGADATQGALFSQNPRKFKCFTLEDEYREVKVPNETRIPAGRYEIKLRTEGNMHKDYGQRYTWHQGVLWLQNVPGFEWIYLHVGNTDLHTSGCILVGMAADASGRLTVQKSVLAYEAIYKEIAAVIQAGEEVWIDIQDYA